MVELTSRMTAGATLVCLPCDGEVADRLRAAGVDVRVVPGAERAVKVSRGALLVSLGAVLGLLRFGWRAGAQARAVGAGVVVARSAKSLVAGAVVSRRAGVPLVWSVHDRIVPEYLGRGRAVAVRLLGRVLADAVVVNSRSTLETVHTRGRPVLIAPPTVRDRPVKLRPAGRPLRRVVMVGRLAPWKGQHVFLDAFEAAFAGTDVAGVVVGGALFGEEDYAAGLRAQAGRGRCASQISFTGHVDDVGPHIREADVLVHASVIPEPFGAVVIEGLQAGCAVIATTPGGPAEVITDGVDGLLVACGSVEALAAALGCLKMDDGLRGLLAVTGPRTAAVYGSEQTVPIVEQWFDRVRSGHAVTGVMSTVRRAYLHDLPPARGNSTDRAGR